MSFVFVKRPPMSLLLALIVAVTALTWFPVLRNDFVHWDDTHLILENPLVRSFSPQIFTTFDPELYIPLTLFTFQVEHALFGFDPFFFHLDNLLLHIVNGLLVFAFLAFLRPSDRTGTSRAAGDGCAARWCAVFGALLFALHPLHAEAVAWVSARKELLFTAFFLASIIAYILSRRTSAAHPQNTSVRRLWHFLSLLFFLLSLLAKATAITLPIVLLLLDYREGRKLSGSLMRGKWAHWMLALLFGLIAIIGQRASTFPLTPFASLLLAARSIVFSLTKLLLPIHLSALYPAPPVVPNIAFLLPVFLFMLFAVLLWILRRRSREMVFGGAFFLVTLAPGLLSCVKADTVTLTADHYTYLPSVGWVLIIVVFLEWFLRRRGLRIPLLLGMVGVLLLFARLATAESAAWKNTGTLFGRVLREYPDSHIAHNNLGFFLMGQGDLDGALAHFEEAVRLRPEYTDALLNIATVYAKQKRYDAAEANIRRALAINPENALAHFDLGGIHFLRRAWDEAILEYRITLQLSPSFARASSQLAKTYLRKGMEEKAR